MKIVKPIFSIIIPVFNSEDFIEDCVLSILNQDFHDFEIILLNNNSRDSTLDLIKNFKDKRISVFTDADNGVYDAMNKGIELSKGEWLYFMGSDDYLFNNQVLNNIWSISNYSKLPVIYGNVLIKGNPGWAKDGEIYAGRFTKNRMLVKAICHQAVFYKRDFIIENSIWFDLRFFVSADWHFNLSCRRLTKFKYVDIILAVFQAGGISSFKSDSFRDYIRTEFIDLLPGKYEILVKEFVKRIISYAKKAF